MDVKKIWIFSMQDNACGGLIYANTKQKALNELSKDRKELYTEDFCLLYRLVDINKDFINNSKAKVVDLW